MRCPIAVTSSGMGFAPATGFNICFSSLPKTPDFGYHLRLGGSHCLNKSRTGLKSSSDIDSGGRCEPISARPSIGIVDADTHHALALKLFVCIGIPDSGDQVCDTWALEPSGNWQSAGGFVNVQSHGHKSFEICRAPSGLYRTPETPRTFMVRA